MNWRKEACVVSSTLALRSEKGPSGFRLEPCAFDRGVVSAGCGLSGAMPLRGVQCGFKRPPPTSEWALQIPLLKWAYFLTALLPFLYGSSGILFAHKHPQ